MYVNFLVNLIWIQSEDKKLLIKRKPLEILNHFKAILKKYRCFSDNGSGHVNSFNNRY